MRRPSSGNAQIAGVQFSRVTVVSDADLIQYVEGFVYSNGLFPIDHAFVKYGDRYIDPTFERALKRDPRKESYVSLIELDPLTMAQYQAETGYYGEMYRYSYFKRFRPDLAEWTRKLNPNR